MTLLGASSASPRSSDPLDLPDAELSAAVLDGDVYRLLGVYRPIDARADAAERTRAVLAGLPPRVMAERWSAAWIWGALPAAPAVRTCCVSLRERARPEAAPGLQLREVVIEVHDVAALGGRWVTTPRRTLLDLARHADAWDPLVAEELCRIGGLDAGVIAAALDGSRRLPGRRRAQLRLGRLCDAPQPLLTR